MNRNVKIFVCFLCISIICHVDGGKQHSIIIKIRVSVFYINFCEIGKDSKNHTFIIQVVQQVINITMVMYTTGVMQRTDFESIDINVLRDAVVLEGVGRLSIVTAKECVI